MMVPTTALPASLPPALHIHGADGHNKVAIHKVALFVHHQAAVGVAVEGHAHVVLPRHDALAEAFEVRGAAAVIDVRAVRLAVDEIGIALEASEQLGRGGARRAVGAVHQHAQTGEVGVDGGGEMVDVLELRLLETVVQHADLAARGDGNGLAGEDLFLDLRLRPRRALVALFIKDLDAVVLEGLVALRR